MGINFLAMSPNRKRIVQERLLAVFKELPLKYPLKPVWIVSKTHP